MLTILINAYSVCPGRGSEPGMGWNWCSNLARHCELHIITESEFRGELEAELRMAEELGHGRYISGEQAGRMHFHFNTIGGSDERAAKIRRMCWNQGDWRFYWYYSQWQRETLKMARAIVCEHRVDIIHQLNMVGFREPGYLWKIKGIPFVWGPIGGLGNFPTEFAGGASLGQRLKFRLKNAISLAQLLWMPAVDNACKRADLLISATPSSVESLKRHKHRDSVLIPETGTYLNGGILKS